MASFPAARNLISKIRAEIEIIDDARIAYRDVLDSDDPVSAGKTSLLLTRNKGAFVRQCPGTRCYTCCDYKILHIGSFCTMDCSYCILQSYFHPPILQFFLNEHDLQTELQQLVDLPKISRVGTGEFTDSLIWEPFFKPSDYLISFFSRQDRAVLELKTKTSDTNVYRDRIHNRKTIAAWSVNTRRIIREQERGTASLDARLRAAAQCETWGYPVAFHFDPIILYDGCEEEYEQVVAELFRHVSADNVVWISLGTFRFMPDLKTLVEKRFPLSNMIYGEFINGLDGKMRYFKPLRIGIYRRIVQAVRSFSPHATIYFCMEDDEVWEKSLGFLPGDRGGLPHMLDESAVKHCGLDYSLLA